MFLLRAYGTTITIHRQVKYSWFRYPCVSLRQGLFASRVAIYDARSLAAADKSWCHRYKFLFSWYQVVETAVYFCQVRY